jgi:hypothetical protein
MMTDKSYTTKSSLESAIHRLGFQNIPYEIVGAGVGRVTAVFTVELAEDKTYIENKGFRAKVGKQVA